VVLDANGGALNKMVPIIKKGLGSPIGSGKQYTPWIHSEDLANIFAHLIEQELDGSYNVLRGSVTNKELMKGIAKTLGKPFWMPNVPSFILKMIYGEMALMLLYGVRASNQKLTSSGFKFKFNDLDSALKDVLISASE
jgi:NAD dependent epimerase/dehydratase family enzyme